MKQSNLSRLEAAEWSPRPHTVKRLAESIAAISGRSVQAEIDRLLDGVPSRFDAVQEKRSLEARLLIEDQLQALVDGLSREERAVFNDAMAAHARRVLKNLGKERRGPKSRRKDSA